MPAAGCLSVLDARGPQNAYLFNPAHDDTWDVRRKFLQEPYMVVYNKLPTSVQRQWVRKQEHETNVIPNTSISFTLLNECDMCDMVNCLDLVIPCCGTHDVAGIGGIPDLGSILRRVEVRIGDSQIDCWRGSDMGTLVDTMCAVFGRKVSRHGDRLFVPLVLAPFHTHNLLSLVGLRQHAVVVTVEFAGRSRGEVDFGKAEIYGNAYLLSPSARNAALTYEMGIVRVQWDGDHVRGRSLNHTAHRLSFDHPVSALLFWGIDKKTVTNVALTLNGHDYYDGPLDALERMKEERGLGHVEPVMIFFSQEPPCSPNQSTVNFSRIDTAQLYVRTASAAPQPDHDPILRIYTLSVRPMRVQAGMGGMCFEN